MSQTPFNLIDPGELNNADLRPDQIVFVNCPGYIQASGLRKLTAFVVDGGFLFTTDWALKHVLEKAFPGYVKFNEKATADEVVRVEVLDNKDPFLKSILGPGDDPQWWLEGSSYPIRVLDEENVNILVTSQDIKRRYGEAPFLIIDHFSHHRRGCKGTLNIHNVIICNTHSLIFGFKGIGDFFFNHVHFRRSGMTGGPCFRTL